MSPTAFADCWRPMRSCLHDAVARARPSLGVVVSIEATGADAERAIAGAFAEIELIHDLMSFHERDSDITRLNTAPVAAPIKVDPRTIEVLAFAAGMSAQSDGAFDVSIAPHLVRAGALPAPRNSANNLTGNWRDIVIDAARSTVAFARPMWVDVGGIAKGYAVDRAIGVLRRFEVISGIVNAGGDLRTFGEERDVLLRAEQVGGAPVVTLADGALASSKTDASVHVAQNGSALADFDFVAVMAPSCMVADALTKVVLLQGEQSQAVLRAHGATAMARHKGLWREI